MEYDFRRIEKRWQEHWKKTKAYQVSNESSKPKCYVLDMFPYPSGAGLHVGHPLGYIASDIYSRYKRSRGFNVLHPMGYDSFGLPAEQYALETGQHPAVTTEKNIETFRRQLDTIGFGYDWSREVRTSAPEYYKWTQWIFLRLFDSWYNRETNRAEPISTLIPRLKDFDKLSQREQAGLLMNYRLAYCSYGEVNWCEALGTVLANDEVVNGVSERGGYPVVRKKLRQWYLRITEYADRLLEGLERIDFSDAMKDMQTNWIGKSSGAEIDFKVRAAHGDGQAKPALENRTGTQAEKLKERGTDTAAGSETGRQAAPVAESVATADTLRVYTTRPDTIFGVDFMVIAPEHALVEQITSAEQQAAVDQYLNYVKSRSERERMAEKKISGVFTGAYALNPFNGREIPIWISEYVLAGYGTGAIMAVPCGDERDHKFAQHFNIPITNIIGAAYNGQEANATKDAILQHSDFLDGMKMRDAIEVVIDRIEKEGIGKRKTNYRIHDAAFSRQRYWGEPFPIQWLPAGDDSGERIACPLGDEDLPLRLPEVQSYSPGPNGEGPLANIPEWTARHLETNTMPGFAGSSWYFLRYMDPHNDEVFCDRQASDYWGQVDLYVGGTEHAVGHLLYSRMWTKVLYDLGYIGFDEPFKKLVNQGMIQGSSRFVYRLNFYSDPQTKEKRLNSSEVFISKGLYDTYSRGEITMAELYDRYKRKTDSETQFDSGVSGLAAVIPRAQDIAITPLHVDVNMVTGTELDLAAFKQWRNGEYADAVFLLEDDGKYICGVEVEKMSKSKYNTVNPDVLVEKYGADTFRMYEMFLGPVEMSKPWDTLGIEGVHRFLRKLWRLFYDDVKGQVWNDEQPTPAELKALHKIIKKIEEDNERLSFNTGVSAFMIGVNELTDLKCHKRKILEPFIVLLSPYAPHIAEELWHLLGNSDSVLDAPFPALEEKYLVETTKTYPLSINGKVRDQVVLSVDATQQEVEEMVRGNEIFLKWAEGKPFRKVIYVKGKMINVVV